jgi:hypothetical protein
MFTLIFEPENQSAAMKVEELNQANVVDENITGLEFNSYHFDEDIIVHAVIDLFRRAFRKGRRFDCLKIEDCRGPVDEILHVASSLDVFDKIWLIGETDLSHYGVWSISTAMKFNECLAKLELGTIEMTKQLAATLGAGLVTSTSSPHFKELQMSDMKFANGAITEFVSGLKQNSSLCILNVDYCNLGDAGLAELVGAVESHPSLKELSLWGNGARKQAWVALGKLLASKSCQL